jgi:putative copper resistance protein D
LLQLAATIDDRPLGAAIMDGTAWLVLTQTRFGTDWQLRLILAVLLFASVLLRPSRRHDLFAAAAGTIFVATLAWAGHGGATPGSAGYVQLAADCLHLIAAAAWFGALVPLALLIGAAGAADETALALAQNAVLRFSTMGVVSVGTLLATGIVNSWFLTGTVPALVGTDYGRLLLAKVALFFFMVGVAGFNRLRLTPCLAQGGSVARNALRRLGRNSAIEAMVGAIILVIVGVLGTLPPGLHQQATWPFPIRVNTAVLGDLDLRSALLGAVGPITLGAALIVGGIVGPPDFPSSRLQREKAFSRRIVRHATDRRGAVTDQQAAF